MDYNFWQALGLFISLFFFEECSGYPLKSTEGAAGTGSAWLAAPLLLSAALLVTMVMLLVGCLCCRRAKGFQEFTDAVSTLDVSSPRPAATLFPPLPPAETVRFEPLPDIRPRGRHAGLKPAPFTAGVAAATPAQWFDGESFPRGRLQYVRELGGGWFGRVVAGQAHGLGAVVVRILREDAPPPDQRLFLQQARAYRDLRHLNVLRMLGCCVEAEPLLVLLEDCARGDLKSCLRDNPAFPEHGGLLRLASDVARGLQHMLDNGFVHTDLAARNCLVTSELRVKVGDYGNGLDRFEADYYVAGEVAVPIRWCAPETLDCTDTTIQTKQVNEASNVWSLGVLLWEVAERGRLPYDRLTDDEVVGQVIGGGTRLPPPSTPGCPNAASLYELMRRCWSVESARPDVGRVAAMLDLLAAEAAIEADADGGFQRRWDSLAGAAQASARVDLFQPHTDADNEHGEMQGKLADRDADLFAASEPPDDAVSRTEFPPGVHTPSTTSPQPSVTSFEFAAAAAGAARSDSLNNLRGSVDDLDAVCETPAADDQEPSAATPSFDVRSASSAVRRPSDTAEFDSWLRGGGAGAGETSDSLFVREISAAIRDLDDALALEETRQAAPAGTAADFRLGRLDDAEEEMWRGRIERAEFSQKVKEKSRSVADLMVLTHIESDTSDSDASLTWSFERNSNRASLERGPVRASKGSNKRASLCGSENDLRSTVLGDDFVESLQKRHVARRDSSKNLPSEVAGFLREESKALEDVAAEADNTVDASFLAIDASEKTGGGVEVAESRKVPEISVTSEVKDNTHSVIDRLGNVGGEPMKGQVAVVQMASASECNVVRLTLAEVSGQSGESFRLAESPPLEDDKEASKSILVEDNDSSMSLDEFTLSEEPTTMKAPPEFRFVPDEAEPVSLTLVEDLTSSETSLVATSLEDVDETSLSPIRKPVPRPRRSTFDTIEVQPPVPPRRRSLSSELRLSEVGESGSRDVEEVGDGNEKTVVEDVSSGLDIESKGDDVPNTVGGIVPIVDVVESKAAVEKVAFSELIEVANELINETISKSIESVNGIKSGALMPALNDNLGVVKSTNEQLSTEDLVGSLSPKEITEKITKSNIELNCLKDPVVALPVFKLEASVPPQGKYVEDLSESSVILGPCDDFTLDFFKGLKTTFEEQSSIHDWDSLVEESARAEPLLNDSNQVDGKKFNEEYNLDRPNDSKFIGSQTFKVQTDYSKLNGFSEEGNIDKVLVGKSASENQLIFQGFNLFSKIDDEVNVDSRLSFNEWNGIIDADKLDKELVFNERIIADQLEFPEIVGRSEELKLNGKMSMEGRLPNSEWNGLASDIEVDNELSEEMQKSVPAVENKSDQPKLNGKTSVVERLPNSEWNGFAEDIEVDYELSDVPNKEWRSVPEAASDSEESKLNGITEADGFADDFETDKESNGTAATEWHSFPESSDKSEDSNKLTADDPSYPEWTLKDDADLKAEAFSDWDGKHEDDSKQATPDDERSSDSGFRDKGSLSESCEDEKYHLEDIEAELEAFQRGCHDLEPDPDVVFNGEFKDDGETEVEPLDFAYLRDRVDDDAMKDSLEGALPRSELEDLERTDLDETLTAEAERDDVDIYEAGNASGWFLHPPEPSPERARAAGGEVDFLAALRNELTEKLPGQSAPSDSESDSDNEDEPRRDVIIHYNTFQAPLSPILEEPYPASPDSFFPRSFEQEVCAALDSLESSTSADSAAAAGCVRLEDFDSTTRPITLRATARVAVDDVLQVDTETNEARLLDSPVPGPHLAFAQRRELVADGTYSINNHPRSAVSDSPGSEDLSFCTPDMSPSRVVEISVGANDEAAMIVADLNESLRSRSAFNTCSDEYSQVSHPSLEADSSEEYSQSEESGELDLSPVRRLDLLTLGRRADDAWDRHMDGGECWGEEADRDRQISQLGSMLRGRPGHAAVAVSPNAANEMKNFLGTHRMEVNGNELKMYNAAKNSDWLDDIFNVGTPPQKESGSSSPSEYAIAADGDREILTADVIASPNDFRPDIQQSRAESDAVAIEVVKDVETAECDFAVKADDEKQSKRATDAIVEASAIKSDDVLDAKMAVKQDVDESIVKEGGTKNEALNGEVSYETQGADKVREAIDGVKVSEEVSKDSATAETAESAVAESAGEGDAAEDWTSMLAFSPADEHLVEMSTSFSAPDPGDEDEYAPDWETDSSSSGEFTWQEGDTDYADDPRNSVVAVTASYDVAPRKPYECLSEFPMESIAEEDEDDDDTSSDGTDGSGEEFVPSAWDSAATPTRSALRSPDKVSEGKKIVTFKRQKYHCVYEYPRDVAETEVVDTASSDADYFGFSDEIQTDYHSFAQEDPVNYQNLARENPVSYATFAKENPVSYATFAKENPVSYATFAKDNPGSYPGLTKEPPMSYTGFPKSGADLGGLSGLRPVDYASYADWELNDGDGEEADDDDEPDVAARPAPAHFDFYKLGAEEFGAGGADDGEFFVSSSSRPFAAFAPSQFEPSQFFPGNCFDSPPSTGETPPSSPRSPPGLGELRHTRDRLKLHLPPAPAPGSDSKRAAPDSDDSGVGSTHGAQTPAALEV